MNSKIQLTTAIRSRTLVALALTGFALLPCVEAVVPAPDGGYPNFTTAEGTKALQNLTTGTANTGLVGIRFSAISPPASTRVLVQER